MKKMVLARTVFTLAITFILIPILPYLPFVVFECDCGPPW